MALLPLRAIVDTNTVQIDGLLSFRVVDPDGSVLLNETHQFQVGAPPSEVGGFLRAKASLMTLALLGSMVEEVARQPRTIAMAGGGLTLTNVGIAYDSIAQSKGLGFFEGDFTGATRLRLTLMVSKVGTGIQSWQLWNMTNSSQVAVVDDAGAAGDKILTTTVFGSPVGFKQLRIRAKSTVGTDSPTYYGACVSIE